MGLNINYSHSDERRMRKLCEKILSGRYKIYLLGTNEWAIDIAKYLNIEAYINEFSTEKHFNEKPLLHDLGSVDKHDGIIISCNVLGRPWTVKSKLDQSFLINIDYFSFWRFSGLPLMDSRGWSHFRESFDLKMYSDLYDALEDSYSKVVLENIINFRLTQDMSYLKFFPDRQIHQYFESFLELNEEIFVDIGGFDGFTSKQYLFNYPNSKGVKFFEPDASNLKHAKYKLGSSSDLVEYFEFGVGNKNEQLRFAHSGSASSISEEGDQLINITTIDDALQAEFKNTHSYYLKMDIEGWELNALEGAKNFIRSKRPKLAICVYHKPHDFIMVFKYIKQLVPDYKVSLRHYTEGIDETVLYFF
jgi:FkbM family methyltransferase